MHRLRREEMSPMQRRQFVQSSAAAITAASAASPLILHAADKAGRKRPVVGVDGHRYEIEHDCFERPAHLPWGDTHGVCVDSEGLVYVKHRLMSSDPTDAIHVYDGAGRFVRSFGREFHGGGHGIDVRSEGKEQFLYLSDLKGYIAKMTLRGELVWRQPAPKIEIYANAVAIPDGKVGRAKVFVPTNIAFAPNGDFYVADGYGSHYILHYNAAGELIRHWGGRGAEPGKLSTPHGIWWDGRGETPRLCVADRANQRLQYFTPEGEHAGFVEGLLFPADVDIRGDVMLVPDLFARITLLDKDNRVIAHLGDDEAWREQVLANNKRLRSQPDRYRVGRFVHPHDACFDADGNIYVVEWVPQGRAAMLRRVG
ncbi:MAG: peptidase [Planctomycetales bacterium]|nr:peptidase [Planctomycetales bacterium]